MSSKKWLGTYLVFQTILLLAIVAVVYIIDPFFHYHKPLCELYYTLSNERSQNDGIIKHFDYDALITGTSMTENFKTSDADAIFGTNTIKVSFAGGSYKEINDNIVSGLENNPELKIVIRGLDMSNFIADKDKMREDLGEYPTYLYNNNPFDDVNYVFNKDILFNNCWEMIKSYAKGAKGGITSFDEYYNWMDWGFVFGKDSVLLDHAPYETPTTDNHLTEEERKMVEENIRQNVVDTAKQYPDVQFYYFFPPYSAAWWGDVYQSGNLSKQIEAEQVVIELILECENIKLYSFNDLVELTTDLNNYKDLTHYGEWTNTDILHYMKEGKGLLTKENYMEYLNWEKEFYGSFDYNSLFE